MKDKIEVKGSGGGIYLITWREKSQRQPEGHVAIRTDYLIEATEIDTGRVAYSLPLSVPEGDANLLVRTIENVRTMAERDFR